MTSKIILQLDHLLQTRKEEVEEWFYQKRQSHPPFIYTSVDLRHSGYKLAPVDTNLFPAGFNNLSLAAQRRTVQMLESRFSERHGNPERVLIVPENHTRNLGYLENLAILADLITRSGRDVRIGNLTATEPLHLTSLSGREVIEYPLVRNGNRLATQDGFIPDFIVLNNDCTSGAPEQLIDIAQPIEPPYTMGWYNRRKSEHFRSYTNLAKSFAKRFSFDHWLITSAFVRCGVVNFHEQKNIDRVAEGVERVLRLTREKYKEHGVTDTPYAFIKADSGTYGMGIMTVRSGEELVALNKKTRNKMNVIKEGTTNTEVIIQEGIETVDRIDGSVAEPMLYMVDGVPVGGAYRVNEERDATGNLNAAGMRFAGMCDEDECKDSNPNKVAISNCNFGVFGLVAALAALASAREVYEGWDIGL